MSMGLGPQQAHDALTAARFSITIDGYEIASFSELSGITTEVEPVDYLSSSDKEIIFKKLPGKAKPPTVVLKRGKGSGMELWGWHQTVLAGNIAAARKSCSLVMYNFDGQPVARYYLSNAWPSKLEVGALKAGNSEVLMETVTLVCEHIQRVTP
ncbi:MULTISPECIES: phage tail protein [unclassified Streptomyces]|uniref:phage tail protein n=1 Tax=unclassified Streptomyces TaxID=2593676 RepID=UPI001C440613|nr:MULTISPECIES: phage tail protein [unclassified Streptomyces]MBV7696574.1 phage tail protein [Streptomyces sp. TRM70350]MBX9394356.1 phage tail protein [Streptomyces sp. TRM72054]